KRVASFTLSDGGELILHVDPDLPAEAVYYLVDSVRDLYRRRGELKLQFISPPAAVARGYRAVVKDPFGIVMSILDRSSSTEHGASAHVEDAKAPGARLAGGE